jgi:hypothetical protein
MFWPGSRGNIPQKLPAGPRRKLTLPHLLFRHTAVSLLAIFQETQANEEK